MDCTGINITDVADITDTIDIAGIMEVIEEIPGLREFMSLQASNQNNT
jgi:hypothetical protein